MGKQRASVRRLRKQRRERRVMRLLEMYQRDPSWGSWTPQLLWNPNIVPRYLLVGDYKLVPWESEGF